MPLTEVESNVLIPPNYPNPYTFLPQSCLSPANTIPSHPTQPPLQVTLSLHPSTFSVVSPLLITLQINEFFVLSTLLMPHMFLKRIISNTFTFLLSYALNNHVSEPFTRVGITTLLHNFFLLLYIPCSPSTTPQLHPFIFLSDNPIS